MFLDRCTRVESIVKEASDSDKSATGELEFDCYFCKTEGFDAETSGNFGKYSDNVEPSTSSFESEFGDSMSGDTGSGNSMASLSHDESSRVVKLALLVVKVSSELQRLE